MRVHTLGQVILYIVYVYKLKIYLKVSLLVEFIYSF